MEKSADVKTQTDQFFSQFPHKRFKKGQILIYGGDDPEKIFYLIDGTVKQYDISKSGEEVIVNIFKPYAFFPMSLAINKRHNFYFFEADADIELFVAPANEVVAFLKAHPDVMFDLLSRLYSGIDGLQRRTAHLMGGTAASRLIFELIIQYQRFGDRHSDGSASLSITESALADRTGLSRETVSREVSKLMRRSLVERDGKRLRIANAAALENALGDEL